MSNLLLLAALFNSPAAAAKFTAKTLDGGALLVMTEGEIVSGDARKFRTVTNGFDRVVVGLKSPGGIVVESLAIGRLIHQRGYSTLVYDSVCASSCALMWIAGEERFVTPSGKVGFHAIYTVDGYGRQRESASGGAIVGQYLSELGLSAKAIYWATAAPPTHANWLTLQKEALIPFRIFKSGSAPKVLVGDWRYVGKSGDLVLFIDAGSIHRDGRVVDYVTDMRLVSGVVDRIVTKTAVNCDSFLAMDVSKRAYFEGSLVNETNSRNTRTLGLSAFSRQSALAACTNVMGPRVNRRAVMSAARKSS